MAKTATPPTTTKPRPRQGRRWGQPRQPGYLREHSDGGGNPRPDLWQAGIQQVKEMPVLPGIPRPSVLRPPGIGGLPSSTGISGALWTQIGPAPIRVDAEQIYQGLGPDSGEVVDVAIDPSGGSDQTIYIACNDGGIWKSLDGGLTWAPKTEQMPSLSMGAVALDPGNPQTVYAGTGNLFDGGGQFSKGIGVYKSIDDGETWSILGAAVFNNVGINRIVLPAPGVLLVGSANGVYRSVDGGLNFGANAPAFNDGNPVLAGSVSDLQLDTQNPATTVYAAIQGQGIMVSTDAGVTFPNNLFANPGAPATSQFISLSQSNQPDAGQTFYASVQGAPGGYGLYGSTDGGANWAMLPATNLSAGQLGYDQTVGVDPLDSNRVYVAFQELWLSTDGAITFGAAPVSRNLIHWDHHALIFSPHLPAAAPTQFYCGTDGGVSTSSDGGATFSNLNEGIATNIFLGIDIGRGNSGNNVYTSGGCQDTGTVDHQPGFAGNDWHLGVDGDGGPVAVDPTNPSIVYGSDDGGFMRSTDAGATWSFLGTGINGGVFRVVVDPNTTNVVYAGAGTTLYQSTDSGANFTAIQTFPGSILAIATTALDSNTLWVGLDDGTVQQTANALSGAGSTWTSYTPGAAAGMGAEAVAIDSSSVNRVVVAYSGFSVISPVNRTQHVFQTTDGGATWTDISGTDGGGPTTNLPDLPLHAVVLDPGSPVSGLIGVAANGGQLLALGLNGVILTSPDGLSWTQQASGTTNNLIDAVWDGGQWVAVGLFGTILTSPDGVTWTPQSSGGVDALQGIAWSGSLFTVSDASTDVVLTSPDGVTWTAQPLGTGNPLLDIAWDGGQFIGVGYNGAIVTSPDGVTWTVQASGVGGILNAVASGAGLVAAGQGGVILTSPDGVTWTPQNSGITDQVDELAWDGGQFAAVINTGAILTSPDGVTWTPQASGTGARLMGLAWDGGQFVAVGDYGVILTSPDAVTWTPRSPGSAPAAIVVASDAGVMASLDGGGTWQVLGVGLPAVDCKSLALDSTASPSLLRVGTYGRSCFELQSPASPALAVASNLGFGAVSSAGGTATLTVRAFNVGSASLDLTNLFQTAGGGDFSISSGTVPVTLPPGGEADFGITFAPSFAGDQTAAFELDSTDPANPAVAIPASGTGI